MNARMDQRKDERTKGRKDERTKGRWGMNDFTISRGRQTGRFSQPATTPADSNLKLILLRSESDIIRSNLQLGLGSQFTGILAKSPDYSHLYRRDRW